MLSPYVVVVLFVALISGIETFGQGMIKYANSHKAPRMALFGLLSYVAICFILYNLYSYENMAIINAWWNIITSITITLSGVFLFGEKLKHADIIGIIMVIIGALFLSADDMGLVSST
jgi:multidrug transporter EmrE-like cation transporter